MKTKSRFEIAEDQAEQLGMSVNELCRRAGVNRSTWSRWKKGTTSPIMKKWESVEAVLHARERALS